MRNISARLGPLVMAVGCAVVGSTSHAAPSNTPIYQQTFLDAVTGDLAPTRVTGAGSPAFVSQGNGGQLFTSGGSSVRWDVDQFQPGSLVDRADDYVAERYERPTDQTFAVFNSATGERRFAASKYYQYIDIVSAKAGV